jgi:hypothetical protein
MSQEKDITAAVTIDEVQAVDESEPEVSRGPAHVTEECPFLFPTDRGRVALLFMLGAFVVEAILWGIYSFMTFVL